MLRIDTELVAIDAVVTDSKGNYVTDLQKEDFEILEDGQIVPIELFQTFTSLRELPLAVVFAIDLSGSISPEEGSLGRLSIDSFLAKLNYKAAVGLIAFNNQVKVLVPLTKDHKKLLHQLDKKADYGGSTRIYDAIDRAVTMLNSYKSHNPIRKIVIVITDGFDSASRIDKKELIRRANQARVTVYSITLPSYLPQLGRSIRVPTLLDISRITELTGGRGFTAEADNYDYIYDSIARELVSGYTLGFYPKATSSAGMHRLEIRLKRADLNIRTNRNSYSR
ncbi:MAG: VWA domain-containing protein [Acidobacteriota bacterium]|nr:VWA domain-containing protein [Blastocatellia bacterium]MDW8412030.1 VWA domain-containing protein [Acidobacteriota bacterium]